MSTQDQGKVYAILLFALHWAGFYAFVMNDAWTKTGFVAYVIIAFLVTWLFSPWLQGDENKAEKLGMSYVLALLTGFTWVVLDRTNRKDA